MPDLSIYVAAMTPMNNRIRVEGQVFVAPNHGPYSWMCEYDWGEIAININKLIRDAAVAEVEVNNHTVQASNRKTIFSGAIDAPGL